MLNFCHLLANKWMMMMMMMNSGYPEVTDLMSTHPVTHRPVLSSLVESAMNGLYIAVIIMQYSQHKVPRYGGSNYNAVACSHVA